MNSSAVSDFQLQVSSAVEASVATTFAAIFGQPPQSEKREGHVEHCTTMASVISFFGSQPWALTLIVPEPTATAMALKFTGFDVAFDSTDMGDVVGELTNVLAGEVIAQLARRGIPAQMSLPTVARGNNVEMIRGKGAATQRLAYGSVQGHFWFEICTSSGVQSLCRTPGAAA